MPIPADLQALRRIGLDLGLQETAKWGHPCYMHAGRNVALIGALRDDLRHLLGDRFNGWVDDSRFVLAGSSGPSGAIFRVYDMALYTTKKVSTPEELLAAMRRAGA